MHSPLRRSALALLLALPLGAHVAATAQTYPSKPVRIVVPFAPGGGADVVGRLLAQRLGDGMKAQFVLENKSGAGGVIGTEIVAKSPPDGYTLVIATSGAFAINPVMYKKINYDPDKDFVPIALYVKSPFVLIVDPNLPVKSVTELIAYAKASPNPITYSTPGVGSRSTRSSSGWSRSPDRTGCGCSSMQPRLAIQASPAASSTTTSDAVRPDGNDSVTVRSHSGRSDGARFW